MKKTKIEFKEGEMFINGKKVINIMCSDFSTIQPPFEHDSLDVISEGVQANVTSLGNTSVTQNKNVVSAPIYCGGNVHIGDK